MIPEWKIDTNIFDQLKEEHQGILRLLEMAENSDITSRRYYLKKIESSLIPFARAHEQVLYTSIQRRSKNRVLNSSFNKAMDAFGRNRGIDQGLAEVFQTNILTHQWLPRLIELREKVEAHFELEEKEIFNELKNLFSSIERELLQEDYLDAKMNFAATLPSQVQAFGDRGAIPHLHLS